jgi:hypothetical protein
MRMALGNTNFDKLYQANCGLVLPASPVPKPVQGLEKLVSLIAHTRCCTQVALLQARALVPLDQVQISKATFVRHPTMWHGDH